MSERRRIIELKERMGDSRADDEARIDPVEPDVRSGATVSFNPGMALAEHIIGRVVIVWSYNVRPDKVDQFHKGLETAEGPLHQKLKAEFGEDVKYHGTYAATIGSDFTSRGRYRTIWSCRDYAGIDKLNKLIFSVANADPGTPTELHQGLSMLFNHRTRDEVEETEILVPAAGSVRLGMA